MAYGDDWERECLDRWHLWSRVRWNREWDEQRLKRDDRLDEVGWDIFYCAIARDIDAREAARLAMDGNYRQRRRVRDDMLLRLHEATRRRYIELHPAGADLGVWETQAREQLAFWDKHLADPSYVYFIQSGEHGAVKIGLSTAPRQRVRKLQTGNPDDLLLRHVIPGDKRIEAQLHRRFEPARIRGRREWFGLEYLPVILAFAGGLADKMLHSYDGSGRAPYLKGVTVRSEREIERIRRDIDQLAQAGHWWGSIAGRLGLEEDEVLEHFEVMRRSPIYDLDINRRWQRYRRERYRRAS